MYWMRRNAMGSGQFSIVIGTMRLPSSLAEAISSRTLFEATATWDNTTSMVEQARISRSMALSQAAPRGMFTLS